MKLIKNIQSIAKEVLLKEAIAIQNLTERIDDEFEKCVQVILNSGGRVVVSGIGKSAIVGQKIVATLNSTGTPALFMHAGDAIHGDLGMIQENDVVIVISKSGDTAEIKVLVPLLKRTGVNIIALVSNKDSYLGRNSNFILHAYAPHEADPLNLAPTTSTSVAMALGDALAICLLEARGFTHHDLQNTIRVAHSVSAYTLRFVICIQIMPFLWFLKRLHYRRLSWKLLPKGWERHP